MQRPPPRIGSLLRIKPYDIEQAFWRSQETRRILLITDTIACVLAFIVAFLSVYRITAAASGTSPFSIYLGPRHMLFNLGVIGVVYTVTAALPVLAMILKPRWYYEHRHALCLMNRLVRLAVSTSQLMFAHCVEYVYKAVAMRTRLEGLAERPAKALVVHILHPVTFWMMQSFFILPWRWAWLAQLVNTLAASMYYSSVLPCLMESFLWQPKQATDAQSRLQIARDAAFGCELLQVIAASVQMAVGDMSFMLGHDVCVGLKSVQMLQLFATVLYIFLLPLWVVYIGEGILKRRFLQALQQEQEPPSADTVAVNSSSSSSSAAGNCATVNRSNSSGAATPVSGSKVRQRTPPNVIGVTSSNTIKSLSAISAGGGLDASGAVVGSSAGSSATAASRRNTTDHSSQGRVDGGNSQSGMFVSGPGTPEQQEVPGPLFEHAVLNHPVCAMGVLLVTWLLCEYLVANVFTSTCRRDTSDT